MAGLYKATHFKQTTEEMADKGIPAPAFFLVLTLFLELVGTAMMFANVYVWLAALLWIAFTIPATPIYHGKFLAGETIIFPQFVQVGKNLSIIGGLLALAALDPTLPSGLKSIFFA